MKRGFALALAFLLPATLQAKPVDCRPPTTVSEATAAGHEYVVKARVIRVRPTTKGGVLPVMFSVMRKYHGAAPQILTVDFEPQPGRVLSFHPAEIYLLSTLPSPTGASDRGVGTACTLRQLVDVR